MSLSDEVLAQAFALGFDAAGIVPVGPPRHGAAFADWLAAGYGGEMAYLAARAAERLDPTVWLPDAHSLILLAANYNPGVPPPEWHNPAHGRIARYAWAADYHDVLKPRLYVVDAFIRERTGRTALGKACVDTAPLLERDFAEQAGLGFSGRNTCLITPGLGSWTFLAALAVPEELTTDKDDGRQQIQPILRQRLRRVEIERACGRIGQQAVEDRQVVAERLAAGRRGDDRDMLAAQARGDRLGLMRIELADASRRHRLDEPGIEARRERRIARAARRHMRPAGHVAHELRLEPERLKRAFDGHEEIIPRGNR